MTALCFWDERHGNGLRTQVEGGPWAIEQFLEGLHAHRFIQSFKTFAASATFKETRIFRERYGFEDLLSAFLRTLARHGGSRLDWGARNVVIGRPVQFAGYNPDDDLAMQRYGLPSVGSGRTMPAMSTSLWEPPSSMRGSSTTMRPCSWPISAAAPATFPSCAFPKEAECCAPSPWAMRASGIAGDAFDYRIVDRVVSPRLGKGGLYRSMGKILSIPNHYYANFARWNQLAMMKGSGDLKELRELARAALEPEPLEKFIDIIEYDLGFALYRAVSSAKVALSSQEETDFHFQGEGVDIQARITRADFEGWIAEDVQKIAGTVDEALTKAGVKPEQIERVFLTGGTSFVPAIRRLFVERFGENCLTSADQFESIAYGLALIGQTEDPGRWAVTN